MFGIELLNQSNYMIWRSCMESYLVGEEFWDVIGSSNTTKPEELKKWTKRNAKAKFVLKRSVSHGLFEHIIK